METVVLFLLCTCISVSIQENRMGWQKVTRQAPIYSVDMNKGSLQITTSSELGTDKEINIGLIGPETKTRKWIGSIRIFLDTEPKFKIVRCTNNLNEQPLIGFRKGLLAGFNDVFDINVTDEAIVIHCNGEVILNYTFSDAEIAECHDSYQKFISGLRFWDKDTASESFRARPLDEVCRSLPQSWTMINTTATFPVPHGTTIPVSISCPEGYVLLDVSKVTCNIFLYGDFTPAPRCGVHGEWSAWGGWSECSAMDTCGEGGITMRSRTCDNPAPVNGGEYCRGLSAEFADCVGDMCPTPTTGEELDNFELLSTSCPGNVPVVICTVNPCANTSCPKHPESFCTANLCGECKAEFRDRNGDIVNCEEEESADEKGDKGKEDEHRKVDADEANGIESATENPNDVKSGETKETSEGRTTEPHNNGEREKTEEAIEAATESVNQDGKSDDETIEDDTGKENEDQTDVHKNTDDLHDNDYAEEDNKDETDYHENTDDPQFKTQGENDAGEDGEDDRSGYGDTDASKATHDKDYVEEESEDEINDHENTDDSQLETQGENDAEEEGEDNTSGLGDTDDSQATHDKDYAEDESEDEIDVHENTDDSQLETRGETDAEGESENGTSGHSNTNESEASHDKDYAKKENGDVKSGHGDTDDSQATHDAGDNSGTDENPDRPGKPIKKELIEDECIASIDAVFNNPREKVAFIVSGNMYIRIEPDENNAPTVSEGYPKLVRQQWRGLHTPIEAAFTDYLRDTTFFFVKSGSDNLEVFSWDWDKNEMEIRGKALKDTEFKGLPNKEIKGIASYREYVVFIYEGEFYLWTQDGGIISEPHSWPYNGKKSVQVNGAFDAFLKGYFYTGELDDPEKHVLLKTKTLQYDGEEAAEPKYSYRKFRDDMKINMCNEE